MTYWKRFLDLLPTAAMVLLVGQAACTADNPHLGETGPCTTTLTDAQKETLACDPDLNKLCPIDRNDVQNLSLADECPGPTNSVPCVMSCDRSFICDNGNCRPGDGGICDCSKAPRPSCEGSCASGFICWPYKGKWGRCTLDPNNPPGPVPGCGMTQSCTPGAECPGGNECGRGYVCQAGTCRIKLGQAGCGNRNDLCVGQGICIGGVCYGDIGASCSEGQCRWSLVCAGGRCGLPDGAACAMTEQCSPGLYCYNLASDGGTAKCHAPCLRQSTGQPNGCGPSELGCPALCDAGGNCDGPQYCKSKNCSKNGMMQFDTCAG